MSNIEYINLAQAKEVLASIGIELNDRQMARAAETDVHGKRKLPFFVDPIDGKLKIEKRSLIGAYARRQSEAEQNLRPG